MTNITEIFGIKLLIIIYNNCSSLTINQMKVTGSEQIILLFGMDWVCFQAPYQWPKDVCNINVFRASWARTPPLCLGLNSRISPRDCESTSRRRGRRQHFDMYDCLSLSLFSKRMANKTEIWVSFKLFHMFPQDVCPEKFWSSDKYSLWALAYSLMDLIMHDFLLGGNHSTWHIQKTVIKQASVNWTYSFC